MKISCLDLAVDDLADIADYIARDNPDTAKRIVSRLWSAVRSFAKQPEMGRPGGVYGTRELVVTGGSYGQELCMEKLGGDPFFSNSIHKFDSFYYFCQALRTMQTYPSFFRALA
jgi:hypothetical protein